MNKILIASITLNLCAVLSGWALAQAVTGFDSEQSISGTTISLTVSADRLVNVTRGYPSKFAKL